MTDRDRGTEASFTDNGDGTGELAVVVWENQMIETNNPFWQFTWDGVTWAGRSEHVPLLLPDGRLRYSAKMNRAP